jgi:phosphatidylglycerophosphate synthase
VPRIDIQEIRDRTYKSRDAWWTVLLVDPLASRLVRFVAPYRRITPNLLTSFATVLGLAAAVCFALADRGWLVAGALLFHASFVVDCMDGKIARLNGTGSMFGAWFDFMFDRLRVIACAAALFGGQYDRTGNPRYLWLAFAVVGADLFRYLNGSQMSKIKAGMRLQLAEARGETLVAQAELSAEEAADGEDQAPRAPMPDDPQQANYIRLRNWLLRRRIRLHLFSGIEFEMTMFIVGPLIGFVAGTTIVALVLLLGFEAALVGKLWLATRRFAVQLAAAEAANVPEQASGDDLTRPLSPLRG